MPNTSDEYKRQVMKDLVGGDRETLPDDSEQYQSFNDFAQRSSREERRSLFSNFFTPDRIPTAQMEPELQKAIAQIKPNEQKNVAKEFLNNLKKRGLSDRELEKQLGLTTHDPNRMKAEDVSKLASFAYHAHPDIFHDVLADRPALVMFLSNPIVGAALGAIAAKWIGKK
ncbi:hypothetical protein V2H45_21315 [Tumidithrix elongata RA019]|uniref:Uncharacterized protein n=1 Tax=Tumidithrix elongata BACA0141 TaxID=2716417 RepID=A0AAW9PVX8_9CYAN|nr:hypothetical protein [Tumidithrix elongata RA019]